MSGTTDFVPFATSASANVTTQATYVAETTTQTGYQSGVASSADCNKVWRQGTFIAAGVATFTANQLSINVADDGNLSNFVSNFTSALTSNATAAATTVVNNALASFTLPFSRITGTIANSQVPQGAVTQYEGQLSINGSQVSGSMSLSGTLTVSGATALNGGVAIGAPPSGASLALANIAGQRAIQINSASGTPGSADIYIQRSTTQANQVGAGPSIQLQDIGASTAALLQLSGGQIEIWQFNGTWQQVAFWNASHGLTLNAPASGDALTVNGTVTAGGFNYSSDLRLKDDVHTITDALAKVNALRGVSFRFKGARRRSLGFVAQEVRQVLPEVVSQDEATEYLSVSYGNIVSVLVEAVKELAARVAELEAR